MTPNIPDCIRTKKVDGYQNVYRLLPEETRLYGTESLYGDWNGETLAIAKDFANSCLIEQRIKDQDPRPYRHTPVGRGKDGARTNKRLQGFSRIVRTSDDPGRCNMLYGSALACLLRNDCTPGMGGTLPNRKLALEFGADVIRFTIANMPNLRAIVSLGEDAWEAVATALDIRESWQAAKVSSVPISVMGRYLVVASLHPSRGSNAEHESRWRLVAQALKRRAP